MLRLSRLTCRLLVPALFGLMAFSTAQAGPHGWGGPRGGYHHHHRGTWVAPALVGGILLGAALTTPSYAQTVVVTQPAYPAYPVYPQVYPGNGVIYSAPPLAQQVGYYCATSGQFYPYVATCNVPWQLL
ncbi:MAG: hypothetical protein QM527_01395 [Alphaproteobacteria bacterium]|nr:hypothetical protein [Alphaproteobacteria bacterium]